MRDGIGVLEAGTVVPPLRGRGCHVALVHHRVYAAHLFGCDMVVGGADIGSISFRNQQRAGLRLAYIEAKWHRVP